MHEKRVGEPAAESVGLRHTGQHKYTVGMSYPGGNRIYQDYKRNKTISEAADFKEGLFAIDGACASVRFLASKVVKETDIRIVPKTLARNPRFVAHNFGLVVTHVI